MAAADVALCTTCEETARCAGCFSDRLDLSSSKSIEIYITLGGSTPMRVMESDSISSVKLRMQACKGFLAKKQKLVFGGRELSRTDSLVKDYGITNGNALHLALRISDLLLINFRTACGEEFEFQVPRHRNVGYLKRRIAKKGKGFLDTDPEVMGRSFKMIGSLMILVTTVMPSFTWWCRNLLKFIPSLLRETSSSPLWLQVWTKGQMESIKKRVRACQFYQGHCKAENISCNQSCKSKSNFASLLVEDGGVCF